MTEQPTIEVTAQLAGEPITLLFSPELAYSLEDWSAPVQMRIRRTPGVGTGWTMEVRTAEGLSKT